MKNYNKLRLFIGKVINEYHSSSTPIEKYSTFIAENIVRNLHFQLNSPGVVHPLKTISVTRPPKEITDETHIGIVNISIAFTQSNKFEIRAVFETSRTILLKHNTYEVFIKLEIENNSIDTLLPELDSKISHELNHALVVSKGLKKDLNGKMKALYLNQATFTTQSDLNDIIIKNPPLHDFLEMIYLSNPYEVQARVQQAKTELNYTNEKTAKDSINILMRYIPLRDATRMNGYRLDDIRNLDEEILTVFVKQFNDNIKKFSKIENPKLIYDVAKFFKYWLYVIKNAGHTLATKIYNLISDKHMLSEDSRIFEIDYDLYSRIFNENLYQLRFDREIDDKEFFTKKVL